MRRKAAIGNKMENRKMVTDLTNQCPFGCILAYAKFPNMQWPESRFRILAWGLIVLPSAMRVSTELKPSASFAINISGELSLPESPKITIWTFAAAFKRHHVFQRSD
jgi:hypothetical protein